MSNVAKLDEYRPHYTIECIDGLHTIPQSVIDDVISGKTPIGELEPEMHIVLARIVQEWASFIE